MYNTQLSVSQSILTDYFSVIFGHPVSKSNKKSSKIGNAIPIYSKCKQQKRILGEYLLQKIYMYIEVLMSQHVTSYSKNFSTCSMSTWLAKINDANRSYCALKRNSMHECIIRQWIQVLHHDPCRGNTNGVLSWLFQASQRT